MLAITRAGGFVALGHETNEAVRERYVGFHQWNFERDPAGAFLIWHPEGVVDVSARLAPLATVEVELTRDGGWADVIITRRPETAGMSPDAIAATAGLAAGFDRPVVRVHRAGQPLPPAEQEAMLVATLDADDAPADDLDGRHPAVGELILDRDAVAVALPGGGRLVRAQALRIGQRAATRPARRRRARLPPLRHVDDHPAAAPARRRRRPARRAARRRRGRQPARLLGAPPADRAQRPAARRAGRQRHRSAAARRRLAPRPVARHAPGSRPRRGCRARSATRRSGRSRTRGCA